MISSEEVNIIDNESIPDDQKPVLGENKEKSRLLLGVGLAFLIHYGLADVNDFSSLVAKTVNPQ